MYKHSLTFAAILAMSGATTAQAVVVNFDDLGTSSYAPMPANYQGLTWTNFAVINGPAFGNSGYANGVVSGQNTACGCASDFGQTINALSAGGALFTLNSGHFTSAWNDGATLLVEGLVSGGVVQSASFTLNTAGPSFLTFNWSGIDTAQFSISGGTSANLGGGGNYFGMDDLSVNVAAGVPEPQSWAMLIAGFGLAGAVMRRRRMVVAA